MTPHRLAHVIEKALLASAPRGRPFFVTSTQAQRAGEAVLSLFEPITDSDGKVVALKVKQPA